MGLKVIEGQSEVRTSRARPGLSVGRGTPGLIPWFASGLWLACVLACARLLLGAAWGTHLASVGSPGPTLAGSVVAAGLIITAGVASRFLDGGRLAQLCAGLGVLASPVFWVLFEDWHFSGGLTVAVGGLRLVGPVSTALWMVGWVPVGLAAAVWILGLSWFRQRRKHIFTVLAVLWLPLLISGLAWARGAGSVMNEGMLMLLGAWSWGGAVLSGLGAEVLVARASSRNPLHALMIAFLVQLVLTAAWVVIGFR